LFHVCSGTSTSWSWRELADKAAERAIAIGHGPDGQADAVAARDEDALCSPAGTVQCAVMAMPSLLAGIPPRDDG
jgi:hypothetical protein